MTATSKALLLTAHDYSLLPSQKGAEGEAGGANDEGGGGCSELPGATYYLLLTTYYCTTYCLILRIPAATVGTNGQCRRGADRSGRKLEAESGLACALADAMSAVILAEVVLQMPDSLTLACSREYRLLASPSTTCGMQWTAVTTSGVDDVGS